MFSLVQTIYYIRRLVQATCHHYVDATYGRAGLWSKKRVYAHAISSMVNAHLRRLETQHVCIMLTGHMRGNSDLFMGMERIRRCLVCMCYDDTVKVPGVAIQLVH